MERDGAAVFNAAALVGPEGLLGAYRKLHLPYLGVDRFTTPGDRGFQVWDTALGRIGAAICYDLRFPVVRAGAAGRRHHRAADQLETSELMADFVTRTRALENRVYLLASNRVGEESGFRWAEPGGGDQRPGVGRGGDGLETLYADIEPARAREKRLVIRAGAFEMDTFADRRPWSGGGVLTRMKVRGNEERVMGHGERKRYAEKLFD